MMREHKIEISCGYFCPAEKLFKKLRFSKLDSGDFPMSTVLNHRTIFIRWHSFDCFC